MWYGEHTPAMAFRYNRPMGTFLRHRVAHAWIAVLAILFGCFAPSLSCAMTMSGAKAGSQFVEVCTEHGIEIVQVDDAGAAGKALAMHAGHCAGCVSHHAPAALPPVGEFVIATLAGHDAYPPLFYHSPRPLASWVAAHPRGPPALLS
jgi:hypothetical protein